ncbi:hypothetical protein HORIV_43330 [Vreelandella olivaria]|uniref:Cystathionine beta-lyase n=1 Tax=Vreelandella olivaria TaxID=390919 RepID=A0ABM7GMU0_9GAMM|nr:hypothetical protein HORIV_43330 [Halomonas olivaria]
MAELENAVDARLFASGIAAATTVFQALKPGDSVIAPKVMYWALRKWLQTFGVDAGLNVRFVDTTNLDELRVAIDEKHPLLFGWKHQVTRFGQLLILQQ